MEENLNLSASFMSVFHVFQLKLEDRSLVIRDIVRRNNSNVSAISPDLLFSCSSLVLIVFYIKTISSLSESP